MPEALQARIRDLTDKAVSALEQGLDSTDERIKLESAKALLDRAYGKPATSGELKLEGASLASEHLQALQERMQRRHGSTAEESLTRAAMGPTQGAC